MYQRRFKKQIKKTVHEECAASFTHSNEDILGINTNKTRCAAALPSFAGWFPPFLPLPCALGG